MGFFAASHNLLNSRFTNLGGDATLGRKFDTLLVFIQAAIETVNCLL